MLFGFVHAQLVVDRNQTPEPSNPAEVMKMEESGNIRKRRPPRLRMAMAWRKRWRGGRTDERGR
jgi:hypothetical protein